MGMSALVTVKKKKKKSVDKKNTKKSQGLRTDHESMNRQKSDLFVILILGSVFPSKVLRKIKLLSSLSW